MISKAEQRKITGFENSDGEASNPYSSHCWSLYFNEAPGYLLKDQNRSMRTLVRKS